MLFGKLLNMTRVGNFDVIFGKTLNHSVYNSAILCNVTYW